MRSLLFLYDYESAKIDSNCSNYCEYIRTAECFVTDLNPANVSLFRALDLLQNILLLNIVLFIFVPTNSVFKIALIIGIITMIFDYVLETIAVLLSWWFPLGGIQFHPLLIIPLEMVVGFIFLGISIGIILTFPEKIRDMNFKPLNWLKPLFKESKYDYVWRSLLIFLNAIVGTHGDYSAGSTIWVPGPQWQPLYTFFVWFGGGLITLLIFYILRQKIKEN